GVRRPIVPARYFTNAGRESGPILLADHYDSIDVFIGGPGDGPPIGLALPGGGHRGRDRDLGGRHPGDGGARAVDRPRPAVSAEDMIVPHRGAARRAFDVPGCMTRPQ